MKGVYCDSRRFPNDPMKETRQFFDDHPLAVCSFLLQLFSGLNFMRSKGFNHTDLHVGNVAFVATKKKNVTVYPFYPEEGTVSSIRRAGGMSVPTFGRLWKIIDFGLVTRGKSGLVDERPLFLRFLIAWKRRTSSEPASFPEDMDEYPQLDIDLTRRTHPQRSAFIESFAPPSIMKVGLHVMFPENDFTTAYELFFGHDEYWEMVSSTMTNQEKNIGSGHLACKKVWFP
jgi:hypothetical protein